MLVRIEIPRGSFIKYEIDPITKELLCDRIIKLPFPENYGFIPNTKAPDGDELDALVLVEYKLYPQTLIECRIIGYLEMTDEKGKDEKILTVPTSSHIKDISDVNTTILDKIKYFFTHYKDSDKDRWSKVGEFHGAEKAHELYKTYIL